MLWIIYKIKSVLGLSEVKILAYHNISNCFPDYLSLSQSPRLFESQIKYLKNQFEIISLHEAVEIYNNKKRLNRDKLVITFDDNYGEFYSVLLPLKQKYDFKMTLFVTVDSLQSGRPLFVDSVVYALDRTKENALDLTSLGLDRFSLITHFQKEHALRTINDYAKLISVEERETLLSTILNQLGINEDLLQNLVLTWEQLLKMKAEGIDIGSHTMSHPFLSRLPIKEVSRELSESKKILENKLNSKINFFAYPYGSLESYNKTIREKVREAGYNGACSLDYFHKGKKDLYSLDRINIDPSSCSLWGQRFFRPLFALEISGLGDIFFFRWLKYSRILDLIKKSIFTNKRLKINSSDNTNLKCLFIIDQLNKFAGTEKHLYQLTRYLSREKFLCRVIALNSFPQMITIFKEQGIKVDTLGLSKIYGREAIFKFVELYSIIRSIKPDIVQCYHFMSDTFGVLAAKLAGTPIIISNKRDMGDLKKRRQIILNRFINLLINNFISVCNKVGEGISRTEKIPREKITTIYNGVNLDKYKTGIEAKIDARKRLGIDKDAFVIGISCILRPEKDVELFLQAISEVSDKIENLIALVVGDGPEQNRLLKLTKDFGLLDNVRFTGYVKDIRYYIQAMDICCLTPKENEGLSNVILEEMAMGKPVIATDVGGNRELIIDGNTGYIIDARDRKALIDRIMQLYLDSSLRDSMGLAGRKRIEKEFFIEGIIENYERYYHQLFNGHLEK